MIPTLSEAERARLTTVFDVLLAPLLMLMVGLLGAVVSLTTKVIPSEADDEIFPAVSLNQMYSVREWFPADEAPESVKLTVPDLLQPEKLHMPKLLL